MQTLAQLSATLAEIDAEIAAAQLEAPADLDPSRETAVTEFNAARTCVLDAKGGRD
jgi:hypothetical protein